MSADADGPTVAQRLASRAGSAPIGLHRGAVRLVPHVFQQN